MRSLGLAFAVALVLIATPAARADDASHKAVAVELLDMMGMERLLQNSIDQMLSLQAQQNPALAEARPTLRAFLQRYMSWTSLKPDIVLVYQKAFTEVELREMLAFYKTPTGRKAIQLMPKLMQQGGEIGAKRVQDHMPELMEMLQKAQVKPAK